MKVVISGAAGPLGAAAGRALAAAGHQAAPLAGDPRDPDAAAADLAGAGALLHLAPLDAPPSGAPTPAASEYLDRATRGTYVLLRATAAAGVGRVVLGSALALLERYPAAWAVAESWRPRPDPADPAQLGAFLAEESAKQIARAEPLQVVCLRLGRLVGDEALREPYDPRWLHLEDAAQALTLALTVPLQGRREEGREAPRQGWWLYHVPGGGACTRFPLGPAGAPPAERGLGYAPRHDFRASPGAGIPPPEPEGAVAAGDLSLLGPVAPVGGRPIRNVVVFGAGGPLAAAAARALAPAYRLRLTDVRPLADLQREGRPQSP
ncbi:MAG TPA: hypothetical protein VH257_19850, partial [Chloroflexota bacterium]|nr:hypothetical protein [Chloroflexota bacterium]